MLHKLSKFHRLKASVLCLGLLAAIPFVTAAELDPLEITSQQRKTTAEIVNSLHKHHYRDQNIDDALSQRFLNNYLDSLDPSHSYFLQADIDEFSKHKNKFDDDFQKGELKTSFVIFDRYRLRTSARLETLVAQLEDDQHSYDFSQNDQLEIDRTKAAWPPLRPRPMSCGTSAPKPIYSI